jgi:hypothetical protein
VRVCDFHHGDDADPAREPHELLGRVMSCMMSLMAGSQVISMFVAGPAAEKIGIPNLYYGSAVMRVGIGAVGYFKLPKIKKVPA